MKKSTWVWMTIAWVALTGTWCSAGPENDAPSSREASDGGRVMESKDQAGGSIAAGGSTAIAGGGHAADSDSTQGASGGAGGTKVSTGHEGSAAPDGSTATTPGSSLGGSNVTAADGGARADRGGSLGRGGAGGRADVGKVGAQRDDGGAQPGPTAGTASTGDAKGLTIYVIRHAETPANLQPDPTAGDSESFTELGERQVTALTEYLTTSGIMPDTVLVSPAWRAQKTIEPFLVAKDLTGEVWMELDECCADAPTGAEIPTTPTLIKYWKATLESDRFVFRDPKNTTYWDPGAPYEAGLFKVMTARDLLLSEFSQSGKTIFVVGHASAGSILIGLLMGYDMKSGPDQPGKDRAYLYNTGVTKVVQDAATGKFKMQGQNINKPATK